MACPCDSDLARWYLQPRALSPGFPFPVPWSRKVWRQRGLVHCVWEFEGQGGVVPSTFVLSWRAT